MANHRREQVMDAVVTALTGLTTVGANVTRNRVYEVEDSVSHHYNIVQGPELVVRDAGGGQIWPFLDRQLDVMVEMRAIGTGDLGSEINQIEQEAVVALRADYTLGLSFVHEVLEEENRGLEIEISRQQVALSVKRFVVFYRTGVDDPST